MKQFYKEIKNVNKDLQYDEILKLFSEYKQTQSQIIRDKIFNANVKLVFSVSKKYQSPEIGDIEQFGFIALINAIENFDPSKNTRFSTYATKCITNEIQRGLKQVNNIVSVPIAAQTKDDYTNPSFFNIEDVELQPEIESDFDRQLFWVIVQQICTEEETDILLKRFCYEEKLSLASIGKNWIVAPDKVSKAPRQLMWKKLNRILKKLGSNEILKKYYA